MENPTKTTPNGGFFWFLEDTLAWLLLRNGLEFAQK